MSKPKSFLSNFVNFEEVHNCGRCILSSIAGFAALNTPIYDVYLGISLIPVFFIVFGYLIPSLLVRRLYKVDEGGFTYYIGERKYIGRRLNVDSVVIYTIKPFVVVSDGISYPEIGELRYKVESKLILYEKSRRYMIDILVGYMVGIILYMISTSNLPKPYHFVLFVSLFYIFMVVSLLAFGIYYNLERKIKYGVGKGSLVENILKQIVYSSNVNVRGVAYLMPHILVFSLVTSLPLALIRPSLTTTLPFLEKFAVEIVSLSIIAFLSSMLFNSLGLTSEEFLASFSQYIFYSTIPQLFLFAKLKYPSLHFVYLVLLITFTLLAYVAGVSSTNNKRKATIAWLIIGVIIVSSSITLSLISPVITPFII